MTSLVTVNSTEIDARFALLEAQRNNALNEVVMTRAMLAVKDEEIAELKSKIAELTPKDAGTQG